MAEILLKYNDLKGLRILSRSEYPQWLLKEKLKNMGLLKNIAFLIGDIRDYQRLWRAMKGINIVLHCAAMKQIPSCEENPFEAVNTNINGSKNVIDAALDTNVEKVIFVSTDKLIVVRHDWRIHDHQQTAYELAFVSGKVGKGRVVLQVE